MLNLKPYMDGCFYYTKSHGVVRPTVFCPCFKYHLLFIWEVVSLGVMQTFYCTHKEALFVNITRSLQHWELSSSC